MELGLELEPRESVGLLAPSAHVLAVDRLEAAIADQQVAGLLARDVLPEHLQQPCRDLELPVLIVGARLAGVASDACHEPGQGEGTYDEVGRPRERGQARDADQQGQEDAPATALLGALGDGILGHRLGQMVDQLGHRALGGEVESHGGNPSRRAGGIVE